MFFYCSVEYKIILLILFTIYLNITHAQTTFTYDPTGNMLSKSQQGQALDAQVEGDETTCLGATIQLTASGGTSYTWSTGQSTASIQISPTESSDFSVTVTNDSGCSKSLSHSVSVSTPPPLPLILGDEQSLAEPNNSHSYTVDDPTAASYLWTVVGGTILSGQGTATVNIEWVYHPNASISVQASNAQNCTSEVAELLVATASVQDIPLEAGWNLISTYMGLLDPTLEVVFSSISGNLLQVKDIFDSYDASLPAPFNTLEALEDGFGYWVQVSTADVLSIRGFPHQPENVNIHLRAAPAWNLIGYPSVSPLAIEDAFASIMPNVINVKNGDDTYDPSLPPQFNTLRNIVPGAGYWIQVDTEMDFAFPSPGNLDAPHFIERNEIVLPEDWQRVLYPNSMVAYGWVTLDDIPVSENDVIGVFVGEECRALGYVNNVLDASYVSMVINGMGEEALTFKLYRNGVIYTSEFSIPNQPGQQPDDLLPLQFYTPTNGLATVEKQWKARLSPNPSPDKITLSFQLPASKSATISVVDVHGRTVKTVFAGTLPSGEQTFHWDMKASDLPSGLYWARIITDKEKLILPFVFALY